MGAEKLYYVSSHWFVVLVTWFVGKELESHSVSKCSTVLTAGLPCACLGIDRRLW